MSEGSIKEGDVFHLNCGVTVWVVEYKNYSEILVTDGTYFKTTNGHALKSCRVRWWDQAGNRIYKKPEDKISKDAKTQVLHRYKIGQRYMGKHEHFTVLEIEDEHVLVKFDRGIVKRYTHLTVLKQEWISGGKKILNLVGEKYELNCGTIVTVVEVVDCNMVKVTDGIKTRECRISKLKSGKERWYNYKKTERKSKIGKIIETRQFGKYTVVCEFEDRSVGVIWEETKNFQICKETSKTLRDESLIGNFLNAKDHYVYAAIFNGEIVYIGRGTHSRYLHVLSGASSSKYLNMLHFQEEKVIVGIVQDGLSKKESMQMEKYYLSKYKPVGNKIIPKFD